MEFAKIGSGTFGALIFGAIFAVVLPVACMIFWKVKTKEPFKSILVGVGIFIVFALIIEKSLQAMVIMIDHPVSRFINAHPLCLSFVTAAFAGIFEETGRLAAYTIFLKNRKNKETAISYGIGHGGAEIILILGITFVQYIAYGMMINQGTYHTLIEQVPEQTDTFKQLAQSIADFGIGNLAVSIFERCSAVLFHLGASIMVFYACLEKKRFFLYPLAIVLHMLMDFLVALYAFQILKVPVAVLEGMLFVLGLSVFYGAYTRLYKTTETI